MYVVEFQDDRERYLAKGDDRRSMPVFRVLVEELSSTPMRFPACLSFMQYATVGSLRQRSAREIRAQYGPDNVDRTRPG